MVERWPVKRTLLGSLIGALVLSAMIGIYAFLFGNFGETEMKLLATTLGVSYFSVTALAAAAAWEKRRVLPLAVAGVIASGLGFAGYLVIVWGEPWRWTGSGEWLIKSTIILALFAFSFAQCSLLSFPRLSRRAGWLFPAAITVVVSLATLISTMIVFEWDDEWLFRACGVLGILDGLLSLTIPIAAKIAGRGEQPLIAAEASTVGEAVNVELKCPRCGHAGTYATGVIECQECGQAMRLELLGDLAGIATSGKRPPVQYSLRTLLVLGVVVSLFFSVIGARRVQLRQQEKVVVELKQRGITSWGRHGTVRTATIGDPVAGVYTAADWDLFLQLEDVQDVRITSRRFDAADLGVLAELPELRRLTLQSPQFDDAAVPYLKTLTQLELLCLNTTKISKAAVSELRRALPTTSIVEVP